MISTQKVPHTYEVTKPISSENNPLLLNNSTTTEVVSMNVTNHSMQTSAAHPMHTEW